MMLVWYSVTFSHLVLDLATTQPLSLCLSDPLHLPPVYAETLKVKICINIHTDSGCQLGVSL